MSNHRGAKAGKGEAFGKENLRKCHTKGCNNMTPNYRCHECWVKLQGFAPYERPDTSVYSNVNTNGSFHSPQQ